MNIIINGFGSEAVGGLVESIAAAEIIDRLYWIHDQAVLPGVADHSTLIPIDHVAALNCDAAQLPTLGHSVSWSDSAQTLYTTLKPTVLKMLDRLDRYGPAQSYADRETTYRSVFQYWLNFLTNYKIAYFIGSNVPHEITDFVISEICRVMGIPTLCFFQWTPDIILPIVGYRSLGDQDSRPFAAHTASDRALLAQSLRRIQNQQLGVIDAQPFYMDRSKIREQGKRQERHWIGRAIQKVRSDYRRLLSPKGIRYAYYMMIEKRYGIKRKDKLYRGAYKSVACSDPDLSRPYIYVALHYQPEATTSPLGDVFVDQYLMVDILLAAFPPQIRIYIKEHPAQGWVGRYDDYLSLFDTTSDRVHFIAADFSSKRLQESAFAVATVTGTVGFESIWKGIPVLHFGNTYYEGGPNTYRIRTVTDAQRAQKKITQRTESSSAETAADFTELLLQRMLPANGADYYHYNSILGLSATHNKRILLKEILARLMETDEAGRVEGKRS